MCPNCDTHVITNKYLGCWVYSLQSPPVSCRRPCVWIWQGGPKFMWCGIGVDTHHYSEAPGSRMNITHSPHTASPTDGLLACQIEGLSCFPSLIDSTGSPSIKSDFLTFNSTEPRKAAILEKQERSTKPEKKQPTRGSFTWMWRDT